MAAVVGVETPGGDPFAGIPAGPELAAALAGVSPAELPGQHAAAWMRAAFRQRNHDDVVFLDALRHTCRSRADDCRRVLDDGFAPKAAAANLGWSAVTASARYGLACFVLDAQPALGAAMYDGVLEERKADIFDSATEGLEDHQVAEVVRIVLPEAPGLAYQALRERILEVARALDPEWAAGRLAAAVARARVSARTSPSGAVDLCGYDLRPDLAQDAKAHIDALAVTVQARLAFLGVDLGVGFLSARIFTRLLDGTLAGFDDPAVIDAIAAECGGSGPGDDDSDGPAGGPDDGPGGPDVEPNDDGDPGDESDDNGGPGSDGPDDAPDGSAPDGSAPDGSAPDGSAPDGSAPDGSAPDGSAPDGSAPDGSAPDGSAPDGSAPDGSAPDGSAPDGSAPDGSAPDGSAPDGSAPDGSAPDGSAPDGSAPDGSAPDGSAPDGSAPDGSAPDGSAPDGSAPDGSAPDGSAPDGSAPDGSAPDGSAPDGSAPDGSAPDGSAPDGSAPDGSAPDGSAPDGSAAEDGSGADAAPVVEPYPAGVALRMRLSTLLGHDERPGELPGLGGTLPEVARRRAAELGAARWHVLVHDHDGRLTHLLAHRAPPNASHDPRHRRRTVEITAPAALLDALELGETPEHDPWLVDLLAAYRRSRDAPPDEHPATTNRDTDRRLPGAALARWIDARDPICVAPGCTVPARRCEHDHTLDWHHGGRTRADGLANLCPAHHAAKHRRGWTYHQHEPGRFEITDPTGTVHHTRSRVARPLPDPLPAHHDTPPDEHAPPTSEDYTPRPTLDGRITTAALATVEYLLARRPARRRVTTPPDEDDDDPPY